MQQWTTLAMLICASTAMPVLAAVNQDPGPMTVFRLPQPLPLGNNPANNNITSKTTTNKTASGKTTGSHAQDMPNVRRLPAQALAMFQIDTGVTPAFIEEIACAINKMPAPTLQALAASRYKIHLSRTVPDAVPTARNQQVRGYEASATWNNIFGMFNRSTKQVVMAEQAEIADGSGGTRLGKLTNKQRRQGIVRHEFGHAVDQYLDNFSHTPEFKSAYDQGAAGLNRAERQVLNYYLQDGFAGKEETFAELFAALNEDACDRDSDTLLRRNFATLAKLIRQRVAAIHA